jgi:hypothetical protein
MLESRHAIRYEWLDQMRDGVHPPSIAAEVEHV